MKFHFTLALAVMARAASAVAIKAADLAIAIDLKSRSLRNNTRLSVNTQAVAKVQKQLAGADAAVLAAEDWLEQLRKQRDSLVSNRRQEIGRLTKWVG